MAKRRNFSRSFIRNLARECTISLQHLLLHRDGEVAVHIEASDRSGLKRLIRYCARAPFALERLHLVGGRSDQILYVLPSPDPAGRTALRLSALEFLDRLATAPPPRQGTAPN